MKKSTFEIAIVSIVLSTNVVAQQPILAPNNNTPSQQWWNMQANQRAPTSGNSNGGLNAPTSTPIGTGTAAAQQQWLNMQANQLPPTSVNSPEGIKYIYQPLISVAKIQAQSAVFTGTVTTPMGMAKAYRGPNSPITYYVLDDGRVYMSY